jgi:SAM-dependent methyltransferase
MHLDSCRICGGPFDSKSLKLVDTPLANELYQTKSASLEADKFPLELVICLSCFHVQLRDIVSPERMFSNYVYRSGTSSFFRNHFSNLALDVSRRVPKGSLVVEVGSNDGFLLGELNKVGFKAIGIEPSDKLATLSRSLGIKTKTGYLSTEVVADILKESGEAAAIIGNNVFAHIDDLLQAFKLVNELLKIDGIFIFEVADFARLVQKGLFDTVYHEHMSYHTVKGLLRLAELSNFIIEEVFEIEPHGGSLRFLLRKGGKESQAGQSVQKRITLEEEQGLDKATVFDQIRQIIATKKIELGKTLENIILENKLIGYGAPAKLVTFCYQLGIEPETLSYVIDDNEFKQNSFIPGLGLEVVSPHKIQNLIARDWSNFSLAFLVFPWNLSTEILKRLSYWAPVGSSVITAFPRVERNQLS